MNDTLNSRLKPYLFEMRDSVFLKEKRLLINVWGTQWLETYDYSKELNRMDIGDQASEEKKHRILSFPWCISGDFLVNIKFLNL